VSEPSWTTALAEAKSASRHLAQALKSMERLAQELQGLRDASDTIGRLDMARALTEGSDGGVLQGLVVAASSERDSGRVRMARALLDRLTTALGLSPVCERGELLLLSSDEVAEFEVRGGPTGPADDTRRRLYCVGRPGWLLGTVLVARPLLEEITEEQQ
jgi:hypothetical protein